MVMRVSDRRPLARRPGMEEMMLVTRAPADASRIRSPGLGAPSSGKTRRLGTTAF